MPHGSDHLLSRCLCFWLVGTLTLFGAVAEPLAQSGPDGGSIGGTIPSRPEARPVRPLGERQPRRAAAPARDRIDVPIMSGGNPDFQACPQVGEIVGLDPNGDGFLSVRSGPGGQPFHEIDRLYNGMRVAICDERKPWYGVVYATGRETARCNVDEPRAIRGPYTGPCRFGWIHGRYVGHISG